MGIKIPTLGSLGGLDRTVRVMYHWLGGAQQHHHPEPGPPVGPCQALIRGRQVFILFIWF